MTAIEESRRRADHEDEQSGCPCGLFDAVAGLFGMCWQVALPLGLADDGSGSPLRPSERRLLGLLAAGLTDDQVARVLGVSRRTMFRYLENLMARTGAANRFQLALHATRNDWISVPVQSGAPGPCRSETRGRAGPG
ncbi:LuxR C-terminal-related transcriptional regulator [Amycolatopsis vastitatis]|uniref:LuxR C-terminal-related transcriptional regulator n=1 Tax=Amycolatopsis vastitatis TaxID=1905142 RepID=UPI001F0B3811|nr:LuxR C-terminal-related transcriptional regulator [Amycolatopsis vastitatis]